MALGDLWEVDAENVSRLQESVDGDMGAASSGRAGAKAAALIRGKMNQISQILTQMEASVLRISDAPSSWGLSQHDVEVRSNQLVNLNRKKEHLLKVYKQMFSQQSGRKDYFAFATGSSQESNSSASTNASNLEDFGAGDYIHHLTEVERETQELAQQDEQLSFLEGSVLTLKSISHAIGDEVEIHSKLLGDVEKGTTKAEGMLMRNRKELAKILAQKSTLCLFLIALVLLCLLTFLLVATA